MTEGGPGPSEVVAPASEVFEELCATPWAFHGWAADVYVNWGLARPALDLLFETVAEGAATLETGAGVSTVVFALKGAHHTVVSPWAHEHERIQQWCAARRVATDRVSFIAESSQDALPRLEPRPLDVVLIDGDHAFPSPFIDWYYAAGRLVSGGLLFVDDTHLKTGEILRDFLVADTPRWRLVRELSTTAVFARVGTTLIPDSGWSGQPYCKNPRAVGISSPWARTRAWVRLRTRLRSALRRGRQPARAD